MRISDELAEEVRTLRSTPIDEYGRLRPLKTICDDKKLKLSTVRFILYERERTRIKELKKRWRQQQKEEWYNRPLTTKGLSGIAYPMKREPFSYPLTRKEFNVLLQKQEARCKICGKLFLNKENRLEKRKNCHIEHNHKTLEVRGITCASCNFGLGCFKDDIKLLTKAIAYLSQPNQDILELKSQYKYKRLQNVITPLERSYVHR